MNEYMGARQGIENNGISNGGIEFRGRDRMGTKRRWAIIALSTAICASQAMAATPGRERGVTSPVRIEGFDPLIPTLRKWQVPQDLYYVYKWGGHKYTNYARSTYQRYVNTELEGRAQYDIFGNWVTRGWRIYDWRQEQPLAFGSTVFKDSRFDSWFSDLVVVADSKGQYHTAFTVGDEIRTTLTPLTFSRSAFNGIQWDIMSDKYAGTLLMSRVSEPVRIVRGTDRDQRSNYTNFFGLRSTAQLGDFANLGLTFVNNHFGTTRSSFAETSLNGLLTSSQNSGNVTEIIIRITDDSPGDGSGALFFSSHLEVDGETSSVKPTIEGGRQRRGFLEALEEAPILLRYSIPDPLVVQRVLFRMVLSNDYRVEVTSNLQANNAGQPIFLPVARARGNVRDNTNQRVVVFDYGLPSANQITSITGEVRDVLGLEIRGELARNAHSRRYPNINIEKLGQHHKSDARASAWTLNAVKHGDRLYGFGEAFSMDHDYTTRGFIPDQDDFVDYENSLQNWFEYIDDNDDQDRSVDWARFGGGAGDGAVFPGLDENNDLISDFNENQNRNPDYDEPFLRHYTDPPDFLFGMDLNNNTVVDRFENDEEADYPYKKGHRGYNVYMGGDVYPGVALTLGRSRQWLISATERSKVWYLLLTSRKDVARVGRFEVFHMLKFVRDNIADNLIQWVQRPGTLGGMVPFDDPLIAQDAMVNQSYVGYTLTHKNMTLRSKLRFDHFKQRGDSKEGIDDSSLLGMIIKADYPFSAGQNVVITPRWKSMWRRRTQPRPGQLELNELSEIVSLSAVVPVLSQSRVEVGVEGTLFRNTKSIPDPLPPAYVDDFIGKVFAIQYSSIVPYQGYSMTVNVGFRVDDTDFSNLSDLDVNNTLAFFEVFAGLHESRLGGRPVERRGH